MSDLKLILRERLSSRPDLLAPVFEFAPENLREYAEAGAMEAVMSRIDGPDVRKYLDRFTYLAKTRITPKPSKKPPQCGGKNTYLSEEFAKQKASKVWDAGRGKMRVYQCHICKYWHLTHKPKA